MKTVISLVIFILAATAASSQTAPDLKKLDWLVGEWTRTNLKPGRSGSEKWIKNSPAELQGLGLTMRGTDTAFVEKIKIIIKDNDIYYAADVPENKGVVLFKLTKITNDGFVCENPQHDFPKQISYARDGNKLKATISGDGKSIDYFFEKKL